MDTLPERYGFGYSTTAKIILLYSAMHTGGSYEERLGMIIDSENGGVPKHLGKIADSMYEWEGKVAEELKLSQADVAAIKTKNSSNLRLQMYDIIITVFP